MSTNIFIETPWETRNLGLTSYTCDESIMSAMTPEAIHAESKSLFSKTEKFFAYARLTKRNLWIGSILEKYGFYVVECNLSPYIKLRNSPILPRFVDDKQFFIPKRYQDANITFVTFDHEDWLPEDDFKAIAEDSFVESRFHVDQNCPGELADQRFSMWVGDLIEDQQVIFDGLLLEDELVGFMARRKHHLVLAGFKRKYARSGLGDLLWLNTCHLLKKQDYATAETLISTNNIAVLNLYARLGFKFRNTQYSFHYWNNR